MPRMAAHTIAPTISPMRVRLRSSIIAQMESVSTMIVLKMMIDKFCMALFMKLSTCELANK